MRAYTQIDMHTYKFAYAYVHKCGYIGLKITVSLRS
jgi:uncharacterized membrane protein